MLEGARTEAILAQAHSVGVDCGACGESALPVQVIATFSRVLEYRGDFTINTSHALVSYRCDTPACPIGKGAGICIEVPL